MFPMTYDKGTILTIYMSHWHRAIYFIDRGVLLIWIIIWQGPIALAVGGGGGVSTF